MLRIWLKQKYATDLKRLNEVILAVQEDRSLIWAYIDIARIYIAQSCFSFKINEVDDTHV